MAMVAVAQQAFTNPASFRSCVQVGSSAASNSTPTPSSCPISRPSATVGRCISWTQQEFSCNRVGAILKGSSRERRQLGGRRGSLLGCRAGALSPELKSALDNFVQSNKVVLFMKGNRNFPQCGFSNTCIQILNQCNVPYETVNILEDDSLRQGVKEYSAWPTYPQLYIDGEFYGGCDITIGLSSHPAVSDDFRSILLLVCAVPFAKPIVPCPSNEDVRLCGWENLCITVLDDRPDVMKALVKECGNFHLINFVCYFFRGVSKW